MTTIPPHPGLSGLAAREDGSSAKPARSVPEEQRPYWLDVLGPEVLFRTSATPTDITRIATTPADITRAADDDADHMRSDFTQPPRPVCGCCGPQLCCCTCHQRGFLETPLRLMAPEGNGGIAE